MDQEPAPARPSRVSVMLSARLATAGAPASQHRVLNLSATGLCVGQAEGLAAGTPVAVSIGEVERVAADIVWVRGSSAGLRFGRPIDVAAARRRRSDGGAALSAGWMAGINDAYRRR